MVDSTRTLRFAVLVDGDFLKQWQVDCINQLLALKGVQFIGFLYNANPKQHQLKVSLGFKWLERQTRNQGPLKVVSIKDHFSEIPSIKLKTSFKKGASYLTEKGIEGVKNIHPDFLLRFGFGILRGEILDIPSLGVWSFHHADVSKFRGGPTAFWDIYTNHQLNGAILQQLTPSLDKGILLKEGFLKTVNHSYKENLNNILTVSTEWPALVAKYYLLNGRLPMEESIKTNAPIFKLPTNLQVVKFIGILLINKLRFHYRQLFKADFWNIGVINLSINDLIEKDNYEIDWAPITAAETYKADPFSFAPSSNTLFFEHFDYRSFKGHLKSIEFKDGKWSKEKDLLKNETHLSYPFTVNHEGKNYLIAESFEREELTIYELEQGNPTMKTTILKGKWLDPTLIFHEDKWWLFCNQQEYSNEKLFLFFAEELLGPYLPHPLNPIVTDIQNSRPAGTPFFKNGQWYRPAQNCASTYGGSIRINKIECLNETEYREVLVQEIFPIKDAPFNQGIHTISKFGHRTLVDGKQIKFSSANFRYHLKSKLNKLVN